MVCLGEPAFAQTTSPPAAATGFVDTGDARLYYLDHGGSGLPLIFTGQGGSDFGAISHHPAPRGHDHTAPGCR